MKKRVLIFTLLISAICFSQNSISENEKTEHLIQIWGLLKYKHPNVSRGNVNIDAEFIKEFNKIRAIQTQENLNIELFEWVQKLDSDKYKIKPGTKKSAKGFAKNAGYSWIKNSGFNSELVEKLLLIKNNSNYKNHYASINRMSNMVDFNNDKELIGYDQNKKSNRLLFLASFWNKMRYWNVNIYLTETPWNTVLSEMIPNFLSDNTLTYQVAKDKLFSKLNDSHSNYGATTLFKNIKFSLYGGRIVNDTLVIKIVFNQTLANKENIELGDLIYAINGKTIRQYYNEKFSKRISTSNENYLKATIERAHLLMNTSDSLKIGLLKKDGTKEERFIKQYRFSKSRYVYKPVAMVDTLYKVKWKKIKNDIGYINLKLINKKELKNAFNAFKSTKGVVIDLRNYPRNLKATDVPYFLYPKKKIFMKILVSKTPSLGKYDAQSVLKIIKNPFAAGRINKSYYKGKVVLLVDRTTGSMAEYFAMAIQSSPNCITIGEQTFGAVMNRNQVILKDKTTVDFTGIGAFYPDDTSAQKQGLKIDYHVREKAKAFNIYQYLDEAIKIIQGK